MENINDVLAASILKYRKKCRLSQEELAKQLGVTFQAVSKWENAKTAPDITFLPVLADIFGCSIDQLFAREVTEEIHSDHAAGLPWGDDAVIRGVVFEGRNLLQCDTLVDRFTFEIQGEAKAVQAICNIEVNGNVSGGCKAGKSINVSGGVSGGCNSGTDVTVGGHLSGGCNSGGDVTVRGSFSGGCNAGGDITCGGNLSGDVCSGGDVTVKGDLEAERIQGNVICNALKCDKVEGSVTIHKIGEIPSV